MEALWGMPMSCVATGGWHSVCTSGKCHTEMWAVQRGGMLTTGEMTFFFPDGGDLYVWGWNESGQLGLPSQALRKAQQQSGQQAGWSVFFFLKEKRILSFTRGILPCGYM